MEREFMKALHVLGYIQTGSRVICNPPVMDTDEDWVLLGTSPKGTDAELIKLGYDKTSPDSYKDDGSAPFASFNQFSAFRRRDSDENLIVVYNSHVFTQWKVATQLAKRFNLTDKEDRIALFRAIRSGGAIL